MNPTQTKHFDITMDKPEAYLVSLKVNGEAVVLVRLERTADGSLDLNVFETANDDMEIANTYPEFFQEVTA